MSAPIAIKGNKEGLRLMLAEDAPWDEVMAALRSQLERGTEFFHGAELTIDVGDRAVQDGELSGLLALMHEHGLQPSALATNSREGRSAGRSAGIATRPTNRHVPTPQPSGETDAALMVARTLRSGQVLRHHAHVTIVGDVNPGAEVIAGGSVLVWGRLRGTVHAGALGDSSAFVCALELMPSLLRIADTMARQPDQRPAGPETARIKDGQIEVEQWEAGKTRA
ncbi:MAG: septum site-determining protein MinC [Chloroflexi bacterium]|nr:MAG: septum site-determining protein MinC [Chloroflexota bacterium]